jgi:8-oxo-dGTP pyrophosphatase MutT (NUDIX family)
MVEERSAGALVFRRSPSGPLFLLLKYGAGHWDFPKGHLERGEEELDASRREIEEETGIAPLAQRYIAGFRGINNYVFRRGAKTVKKNVVFFLVETAVVDVKLSHEHQAFDWVEYETARSMLTYDTARSILDKAWTFMAVEKLR